MVAEVNMDLAKIQEWLQSWTNYLIANPQMAMALLISVMLFRNLGGKLAEARTGSKKRIPIDAPGYPAIEPLENFDWRTTEPPKLRPFKPKYHLTMALESLGVSDLILMDKTYKDRIALRASLVKEQHDTVVAVRDNSGDVDDGPRIRAAVNELYKFVVGAYLPSRYPTMFKLHQAEFEVGKTTMVENLVTGEIWPVELSNTAPTIRALENLARIVDEEFLILLPERRNTNKTTTTTSEEKPRGNGEDTNEAEDAKYILSAYVTCFPSGFNTRKKLGLRLADIHGPVPHYTEKIERSMDRFFTKLETGKFVKRVNWSVTTDAELFAAFGGVHSEEGETMKPLNPGELDLEKARLRCERQTLHRLPQSKAIVFAFHTYTYPLQDVKAEGLGEDLAQAIDGLKEGSSPQIHFYKRGPVWGEAVKAYMRS